MNTTKAKKEKVRNHEIIDYVNNLQTNNLGLSESEIIYLRLRWLKSFLWMDRAAVVHKFMHYFMRLIMAVGAVLIPTFVSANNSRLQNYILAIGLIVAISTAIEELFRYKDYWYHYRTNAELLRSEGWQFFQLVGNYKEYLSHKEAFSSFATRIETIAQSSVDSFLSKIIQEKENIVNKKIAAAQNNKDP
ncbi:DUF4231 domain-containing protein [Altericista sp. CCNU0014]|uniref:DUF4231 domain-containing protein n=1 Tax=Altericista sp. CCNU0014 TaxID=3082949 RepID=UPI00384FE81B